MQIVLPELLHQLKQYKQFILWQLVPAEPKPRKVPIDPLTLRNADPTDRSIYIGHEEATTLANALGAPYGVGFVFTAQDPLWFVDIDNCIDSAGVWSNTANEICHALDGAVIEVSQSGRGLHLFGVGSVPPHACKNIPLGIELYTENRFVALTGNVLGGHGSLDFSAAMPSFVERFFPPKYADDLLGWTESAVDGWVGPESDEELIALALKSRNGSVFGGRCSFSSLWSADEAALCSSYPDASRGWDRSSADAALAQHLAFWTGRNCERIKRLMYQSGLVRDKWERDDYLPRTITNAVAMQDAVLGQDAQGVDLKATSERQKAMANSIRNAVVAVATPEQVERLDSLEGPLGSARFWIDSRGKQVEEILAAAEPTKAPKNPLKAQGPELVSGYQYLGATTQLEHFAGCVYIQHSHRIFTPSGAMLKPDQFNATYGGYVFQMDESGDKTTRKAWEAFTESQLVRFPKAEATCFRPEHPTGALIEEEGHVLANVYVPVITDRIVGDPTPFLNHVRKVLPLQMDRDILLSYMAACVQHRGVKFQWAPLLQGVEGNGKTLFTRCVAYAVGKKYTHMPAAAEMTEKFNEWLFHKLFIGIEDVYVAESKKEVMEILKPMITNDRLAMRAMQQSQVMGDNRANFMLNSNHKDAIRKTVNDRRFSIFYTAQQKHEDLTRDGMTGAYFPDLYHWLNTGGYAIVNEYLSTYVIPAELNPAGSCHRAPPTSSTSEAIGHGAGGVEQAIVEAIEEGLVGFAGGWVSSIALNRLLENLRMARAIPHNKRRELMQSIGYDWHPALVATQGRVNNPIPMDDGKKPRLFIKNVHPANQQGLSPSLVSELYQKAQRTGDIEGAKEVFSF